jgi:N-acetylmuramoyl-L-alanine amidase
MGKYFLFLFFILFVGMVQAADTISSLEEAKKLLQSSDELEQFRGYNVCKSVYASSKGDPVLSKEALEGIITGGELLKIDVTPYKAELAKVTPKPSVIKPSPPVIAAKESAITTTVMTESNQKSRLMSVASKESGLELLLDAPIDANAIKMSKILQPDKQRFRYVVDFTGVTLPQVKIVEHSKVRQIRLAQFDANTLRMVIDNNESIGLKSNVQGKRVLIDFVSSVPVKITKPDAIIQPPLSIAPPPLVNVAPRDRSKKIIVIDPGHGGKDSGAIGNGRMEKDIVLQISLELADQLRSLGYTVYMTRSNDTFIELKDRTHFANDKSADLFLSIHANSIPVTSNPDAAYGIETYFLSPGRSERAMRVAAIENSEDMGEMGAYGKLSFLSVLNSEKILASNKLALDIQHNVVADLRKKFPDIKDNGAREAPFWVLVGAQMPAILLEVGYVSHPEESAHISESGYQQQMVEGIIDGVKRYFANNS